MKKLTKKSLDELARTMSVIKVTSQMEFVGGGNGTSANPYTHAEFQSMCDGGSWNGGYVEGLDYVGNDTYIYGNSSYRTEQDVYTFPEYITSLSSSGWDRFAENLIGSIPGFGEYVSQMSESYGNMTRQFQSELLEKGYNGSSSFTIVKTYMDNSVLFSIYDANTGQFIISKSINTFGMWQ